MLADTVGQADDTAVAVETAEDHVVWLRAFEARWGRPLRVLHVGNIANNAYLNAKFLRSVGVDSHVVSHDYHHVMATPEWEEVELLQGHGDDFMPKFSTHDLGGYRRPDWFVSGPLVACAWQIAELWGERPSLWQRAAQFFIKRVGTLTTKLLGHLAGQAVILLIVRPRALIDKIWGYLRLKFGARNRVLNFVSRCGRLLRRSLRDGLRDSEDRSERLRLIALYDQAFPRRRDRLKVEDITPYQSVTDDFRDMFRHYDIVQCYATEPMRALLAEKRPYVAFEHGTLRDFTIGDAPLHRLTALAYRSANHTFITNGDCLAYAERLGIENHSPIIHPIDVEQHRQDFGMAIPELRQEIGGDVILFCPIRHDWDIKGTDIHLRALPLIKDRVAGRVKLVLIRWGRQLADSKALLEKLGCGGDVVWRSSMCRITMIKHMRAADVVLDQMALPHFGATAPQAIAAGTPVISSYDPQSTKYIIPEPAPILPAFWPDQVADAVVRALDPIWRADYEMRARRWTDTHHHPDNVIRDQLGVYRRLLEPESKGINA